MNLKTTSFKINTNKKFEVIDITSIINQEITNIGAKQGIVTIFSKHSTSAIVINENETGILKDFEFCLSNLISDNVTYEHDNIDNNASSHLKAFLLSSSETIPIKEFKLDLGTWQSVFFIELDGPRSNRIVELSIIFEE